MTPRTFTNGILLTQQRVRLFTRRQAELAAQEAAAR